MSESIGCFDVAKGVRFSYEYSVEWQSFGATAVAAELFCVYTFAVLVMDSIWLTTHAKSVLRNN